MVAIAASKVWTKPGLRMLYGNEGARHVYQMEDDRRRLATVCFKHIKNLIFGVTHMDALPVYDEMIWQHIINEHQYCIFGVDRDPRYELYGFTAQAGSNVMLLWTTSIVDMDLE